LIIFIFYGYVYYMDNYNQYRVGFTIYFFTSTTASTTTSTYTIHNDIGKHVVKVLCVLEWMFITIKAQLHSFHSPWVVIYSYTAFLQRLEEFYCYIHTYIYIYKYFFEWIQLYNNHDMIIMNIDSDIFSWYMMLM